MTKPSDYQEVDERLDTLIDNDYWTYPKDTRTMISTTKKIKELFHSELDRVREEMINECLGELIEMKNTTRDDESSRLWNYTLNKAVTALTQLAKDNK